MLLLLAYRFYSLTYVVKITGKCFSCARVRRCNTVSHTKIERSHDGRVYFKKDASFTTVAVSPVFYLLQTRYSSDALYIDSQTEADPKLVV